MQEVDIFLRAIGAERRLRGGEVLRRTVGQGAQAGEIADRFVHVVQGAPDFLQQRSSSVLAYWAEHHQDQGLLLSGGLAAQAHHGMEHGAHVVAGGRQGAHDAVHQEGRIGLGDLQHLQVEVAGVGAEGVAQLEAGRGRIALDREPPEAGEQEGEVSRLNGGQFVDAQVVGDLGDEADLPLVQRVGVEFPE